jgi:uncharacterized membrane protein
VEDFVEEQDRERDLERFLTFVDAVVAIAITLLVLPLADFAGDVGHGTVADLLHEHRHDLFGFVLSFAVIAKFWFAQQRAVTSLVKLDRTVVAMLLVWTFTIVVMPFGTALVAEAPDDPLTRLIYVGTMAVSSLLLTLMAWAIGRDRAIRDRDEPPPLAGYVVNAVIFFVALILTLAVPAFGYAPLLLLFVTGWVTALWGRYRVSRPG